jgi:hypothetical protein
MDEEFVKMACADATMILLELTVVVSVARVDVPDTACAWLITLAIATLDGLVKAATFKRVLEIVRALASAAMGFACVHLGDLEWIVHN